VNGRRIGDSQRLRKRERERGGSLFFRASSCRLTQIERAAGQAASRSGGAAEHRDARPPAGARPARRSGGKNGATLGSGADTDLFDGQEHCVYLYSAIVVLGKRVMKTGSLVDPGWTPPAAGVLSSRRFLPFLAHDPEHVLRGCEAWRSGVATRWFLRVSVDGISILDAYVAVLWLSCGRNQQEHPRFRGATASFAAGGWGSVPLEAAAVPTRGSCNDGL
jgi:hypothetical protein